MNDLFSGYTPELITGLTGMIPNDYGIATSLYLAKLAKDYNMELAKSLGIDVSTPDKYKQFVRTNPDAYKHAFLKHQLGYGLLNSTLGGMIQAHVIKNKLNRLQSMDSSEFNNENGRYFYMFNEILQAYKTCEDKTNFFAGQVPEEVRPELLAALDAEDETKFNDLMDSVKGPEAVDETTEKAIEPNESEIQIGDQPEVPDTVADADPNTVTPPVETITDTVTAPEGEVASLTEEQVDTVTPTITAVSNMTSQVQDLENLDGIPENLKEGVEIWKDADEDFSIKIIAETVKKMYAGDFSERKDFSDGEILKTGAEVAKELHDKGEHKTTLTKGIEEVQQDLKVMDLADLYSILGELHTLKDSVINFVDFIAEKDDLGLSPSKKKELVNEILNNGLFVDSTDEFRKDVAETLNSAADYSAKDMSTRLSIFKDFSEGFEEHISPLSDGACECLECVTEKEEEKPEVAPEAEAEGKKVSEETVEIAKEAGTFDKAIEMVEDRIEELQKDDGVVEKFAQFSMDCAVQTAKDNGFDPNVYMSMLYNNSIERTPYQQKVIDKIMKRNRAINRPFFVKPFQAVFTGAPGSARWDKKYGALDDIGTQVAYTMPNMLGQAGKALDQKYGTDTYGQLGSDLGEWMLANKLDQGTIRHFSESKGDMGEIYLTDKLRNKFDNAKTNNPFIFNEAFLPSRSAAKFMYDVEKESDYNKLLSGITDETLKNQVIAEKDKIDQNKTKGMGLLPQWLWYGPRGAVYHTSKKNVNATNDLLRRMEKYQEFAEKDTVSGVKRALNSVLGFYPKQVSGSNRSEYWDAVKEVAKLSDEDKQKIFDNMYSTNEKRTGNIWINSVAGSVLPNPVAYPLSLATGTAQNWTIPNRYRVAKNEAQSILAGDNSMNEKKDFAEGEAPSEEQLSQEVIDNALSNDDQIRALVEKYKMLPTIEAKDQMKADMQTLGFTDEVIQMIEQYAEGNFSEAKKDMSEEAPVETPAEAPVEEEVAVEEAPAEETVDVASMVAPELFDSLLGPGVGPTDPADGTLPVGEVEAPGTDIGHLGTLDQGIPAGEVSPEDDKEVTKVEIVSPEGDNFESIMR